MIRSSELLPEPLTPSTPIFAPGKKARWMPCSTTLSGGCTLVTSVIVKMKSLMARKLRKAASADNDRKSHSLFALGPIARPRRRDARHLDHRLDCHQAIFH